MLECAIGHTIKIWVVLNIITPTEFSQAHTNTFTALVGQHFFSCSYIYYFTLQCFRWFIIIVNAEHVTGTESEQCT